MGAQRIIIIAVSAIAAIGLALIVRGMAVRPSAPPPAAPQRPMTQVLVAKKDLPVGTRIAEGDIGWQAWPAESLNAAFITDGHGAQTAPTTTADMVARKANQVASVANAAVAGGPMEALYGAMVREAIVANEPVTQSKLVQGGSGGYMAVVLKPGMQAVSIPVTATTTAGGFILPGDHVDVMQAHATDASANGGHPGFTASVLIRNVRVLAIDQNSQAPKNAQAMPAPTTATLEVVSADAEILAKAKAQGEIVLALRAYADSAGASGHVGLGSAGTVTILRGGQVSELTVTQ
jgi:pilus assembly protein CpaB